MEELHKALRVFWSQFSYDGNPIPAFPAGRVPENHPFPYFTFEVMQGAFFRTTVPTSFIWCQAPSDGSFNVQAQRAKIMDQVAAAIPEAGTLIRFKWGAVVLNRNPAEFMRYYDPPDEGEEMPTAEPVIGGRISCEMKCYVY